MAVSIRASSGRTREAGGERQPPICPRPMTIKTPVKTALDTISAKEEPRDNFH